MIEKLEKLGVGVGIGIAIENQEELSLSIMKRFKIEDSLAVAVPKRMPGAACDHPKNPVRIATIDRRLVCIAGSINNCRSKVSVIHF